jgi:hypothetical protein
LSDTEYQRTKKAVGVLDQVVVEFEFNELRRERFGELDPLHAILAETQPAEVLEALETQAGYVCYARMLCVDLL